MVRPLGRSGTRSTRRHGGLRAPRAHDRSRPAREHGARRTRHASSDRRPRAEGRSRLSLHTTPVMDAAHRLYEGLGFRRVPERDWLPEPGVPLIGYVLDL